jgi:fructose-1-phosphate kinase PfkB-like protein
VADALERNGVAHRTVWATEGQTRTCVTLIDGASTTELIEPSDAVPPPAVDELLSGILALLAVPGAVQGAAPVTRALALCGTSPPGAEGVPAQAAAAFCARGADVWLDAYKDVLGVLPSVDFLKINRAELAVLLSNGGDVAAVDPRAGGDDALRAQATELFARWGNLRALLVTDGAHAAYLAKPCTVAAGRDRDQQGPRAIQLLRYALPPLPRPMVNSIGAGDTVFAVTLVAYYFWGDDVTEAFRKGLAAGSASCLTMTGADFGDSDWKELVLTMAPPQELGSP